MSPCDGCHCPRCSLAGLGPVALECRSCHWPGGSAGSPQCVRPMGCWFFPVPRPPYVCAVSWAAWLLFTGVPARFAVLRLRCPGPLGSCSLMCSLGLLCCVCGVLGHLAPIHRCARCVRCACAMGGCVPLPPPLIFVFFLMEKKEKQGRAYTAGTGTGSWCGRNSVVSSGVRRRCCGGGRAPGVRLARPDVHGLGPGWVSLGVSLLLELAGLAAVWAVGVGCRYVVPSAGLVRSQGLAVSGCGSGLICVWGLARLGGCDGSGPGFGAFGVVVPVVVCVGVLRRPIRLVTSGRGLAWRPVEVVSWVTGLGGGAAGRGVRRVVLCGAKGSWGAVGAASVGAPTLVGW